MILYSPIATKSRTSSLYDVNPHTGFAGHSSGWVLRYDNTFSDEPRIQIFPPECEWAALLTINQATSRLLFQREMRRQCGYVVTDADIIKLFGYHAPRWFVRGVLFKLVAISREAMQCQ